MIEEHIFQFGGLDPDDIDLLPDHDDGLPTDHLLQAAGTMKADWVTYERADGEPIADYEWVANGLEWVVNGLEWFDGDDEPTELICNRWPRLNFTAFGKVQPRHLCITRMRAQSVSRNDEPVKTSPLGENDD